MTERHVWKRQRAESGGAMETNFMAALPQTWPRKIAIFLKVRYAKEILTLYFKGHTLCSVLFPFSYNPLILTEYLN